MNSTLVVTLILIIAVLYTMNWHEHFDISPPSNCWAMKRIPSLDLTVGNTIIVGIISIAICGILIYWGYNTYKPRFSMTKLI